MRGGRESLSLTISQPLALTIDEYLRRRLMPVEGAIPHLPGIDMYGNTIPAADVGGDFFEYINFQQRYNMEARIAQAQRRREQYLEHLPEGTEPRNEVDAHVRWLSSRPNYMDADGLQYRWAKSTEQLRIAENLRELLTTAGILLVDAEGHGIIAAKVASTVHDTLHAFMLSELDRSGTTGPVLFEQLNLRLAQSATVSNALGLPIDSGLREIATLIYGEIRPDGRFCFVNFGHPPPLVFSARYQRFMEIGKARMAQFLALGLEIPEDHPDQNRYMPLKLRENQIRSSDMAEITLMGRGDILFLYTDGLFDGCDERERRRIEEVIRGCARQQARDICNAVLDYAVNRDDYLNQSGHSDEIDDKTAFIIKLA